MGRFIYVCLLCFTFAFTLSIAFINACMDLDLVEWELNRISELLFLFLLLDLDLNLKLHFLTGMDGWYGGWEWMGWDEKVERWKEDVKER